MSGARCDPADRRLALYRQVGDAAALARGGLFVAEGRLVVERLIANSHIRLHSIAVTPAAAAAMAPVLENRTDIPLLVCDPSLLESITGIDFHRGCLALAYRPAPSASLESFAGAARLLAVEGVANPDNVGGLFRTALAFGAGGVLLDPTSADPLYRKAIRTSMAATLRLPFSRVEPWPSGLGHLKDRGFTVVALTPDPGAVSIGDYRVDSETRLILMVGSEGPGLTAESMRYADVRLRIPIDPAADSLNVVTAAAVALHRLDGPRQTRSPRNDSGHV